MHRAIVVGLLLLTACAAETSTGGSPGERPGADASWLVGDTTTTSCVEEFTPANLANREWAFDGTITEVTPPKDPESDRPEDIVTTVIFEVHRWYKGGSGAAVSVRTYNSPGSVGSAGGPDPSTGARILASGEDQYLWSCGFSMPYSEGNADLFDNAFGS